MTYLTEVEKFHKRATPLTGGISILIALLISGKLYIDLNELNGFVPDFTFQLLMTSIPLLGVFLIDDYLKGKNKHNNPEFEIKGLRPSHRIIIQCLLTIYMILTTGIHLESLGDLFGFGEIKLGIFSIPFTVFCVVGIMNAFNMIDGINGLCSGSAMLSSYLLDFIQD